MLEVQLIVEHLFNIYKDLDSISGSRINREGDTSELVVSVLYKHQKGCCARQPYSGLGAKTDLARQVASVLEAVSI